MQHKIKVIINKPGMTDSVEFVFDQYPSWIDVIDAIKNLPANDAAERHLRTQAIALVGVVDFPETCDEAWSIPVTMGTMKVGEVIYEKESAAASIEAPRSENASSRRAV